MSIDPGISGGKRPKATHIFAKEAYNCYVEPHWCSRRLFGVEQFTPIVLDPFCGTGRVSEAATAAGYAVNARDIVDRGCPRSFLVSFNIMDFLDTHHIDPATSIVGNPPFEDEILIRSKHLRLLKAAVTPLARAPLAR
jgi:hypothetical protein